MQKNKRILSWLLAILMAVSMLPAAVVSAAASAAYSVLLQPSINGQLASGASSSGNAVIYSKNGWVDSYLVSYSNGAAKVSTGTYEFINPFNYSGYAVACKNGKYGIIDASGKEVIPCQYDNYMDLAPDGTLAAIDKSDSVYSVLDIATKKVTDVNLGNSMFLTIGGGYLRTIVYGNESGYYQYLTTSGQPAFGKTYSFASTFSHGYAVVKTVGQDVYQIIDTQGKAVANVGPYYTYGIVGDNGLFSISTYDGNTMKYGYADVSGKVVIQPQYSEAGDFYNGYAVVGKSNGSDYDSALIDTKGNIVIPFGQYKTLSNASSTGLVWAVDKNDRTYVLKIGGSDQPSKPGTPQFTDVSSSAWYNDAVKWAVDQKITSGTGDGTTFSPNKTCTQVEILMFLWSAAEKPDSTAQLPFTPKNSWAAGALRWAYENGMITESFDENTDCSRSSAVMFMWQAAKTPSADASSFTDVSADADYAKAVDWAVSKGITSGTGDGTTFSPDKTCTRAEIVSLLYREASNS